NRTINRRCGIALLLIVALAGLPAAAQSRRSKQRGEQEKPALPSSPVAIVNNPTSEYRSGEVSITVRGNENPIIRLGLAPTGVPLIEFPASDGFFAINPGSGDLLTIEDSPTKETDHFFVIRSGTGFLPAADETKASAPPTSIIVQMSSGMVVTFLFYPVRDIEQNAHRCVVSYDREAIVKARQAAGLATNLDRREEKTSAKQTGLSVRIAPPETDAAPSVLPPTRPSAIGEEKKKEDIPKKEETPASSSLADLSFPGSNAKWSERLHGLRIAVQNKVVDESRRQVTVAVHNTLGKPIQIVPGYPELYIHTLNSKGQVLHAESIKYRKIESASSDGVIMPGRIARFLITYEAPVLGARQRLGVAVAQTNAADEPVTMELASETRGGRDDK